MTKSDSSVVVDLDDFSSWPEGVFDTISTSVDGLVDERHSLHQYHTSADRWHRPAPPQPIATRIESFVRESVCEGQLRVFHASRILDSNEIIENGLRALNLEERLDKISDIFSAHGLESLKDSLSDLRNRQSLHKYHNRVEQVWFTPLRRNLHDGGCDVFFENWGGEFVQRFLSSNLPEAELLIRELGRPVVVLARVPSAHWCRPDGDMRLVRTMVDLVIEAMGKCRYTVTGWDVMLNQDVPPSWIEAIVDRDSPDILDLRN